MWYIHIFRSHCELVVFLSRGKSYDFVTGKFCSHKLFGCIDNKGNHLELLLLFHCITCQICPSPATVLFPASQTTDTDHLVSFVFAEVKLMRTEMGMWCFCTGKESLTMCACYQKSE